MQPRCSYRSCRNGMWANIPSLTSEKVPLTMLLEEGGDEHEAREAKKNNIDR